MKFCELDEKEFRKFVRKCGMRDFLQSEEMYRRYKKMGREAYLLGVKEEGKVVLAGLVLRMGRGFNCARGPVGDFRVIDVFTKGVKKFLKRKGIFLLASPAVFSGSEVGEGVRTKLLENKYKELGEYVQVKWIYTLEPEGKSEEELFRSFRKGHKLSIRYATERYAMRVRELSVGEFSVLKELVDEAGERHEFRAVGEEYFQEMAEAFSGKVKFLVAEMPKVIADGEKTLKELILDGYKMSEDGSLVKDGKALEMVPTAGAMFVIYGGEIVYLFSGSRAKYKKYGGPHLIQWKMIRMARKKGLRYNFYGTKPEVGDGVHAFKTGFHGEVQEYIGTFALPIGALGKAYLSRIKYRKYGKIE